MKTLLLILTLLNLAACSTTQYRYEWALNPENKAEMDEFFRNEKDCKDVAFKGRMMGSRFAETDIFMACLQRRGYKFNKIAVK